jgi:hypothetical protein
MKSSGNSVLGNGEGTQKVPQQHWITAGIFGWAVALALGCEKEPANLAPPAPLQADTGDTESGSASSESVHEDGPPVELKTLTFANPLLEAKATAFDAAARRLAENEWHHSEYRMVNWNANQPAYHAFWCLRKNERDECVFKWDGKGLARGLSLSCRVTRDHPRLVQSVHIAGHWMPDSGTGAAIGYGCGKHDSRFEVDFYPDVRKGLDWERPPLTYPFMAYWRRKHYRNLSYYVQVDVVDFRADRKNQNWTDRQIVQHLDSAESLRDAMLGEANTLEERMRRLIPSQEAVLHYYDDTGANAANPPKKQLGPPKGEYALTPAQTTEILDEALAELDERRELIRAHYKAMHAAMEAAFPLVECLKEVADSQNAAQNN